MWKSVTGEEAASAKYYMIPAKIQNLRAQSFQTSIQLKWSVALRRVNPTIEHDWLLMHGEPERTPGTVAAWSQKPLRIRLTNTAMNNNADDADNATPGEDRVAYLPPGTKYIIRWGDMHPGPSEDSVMGDQTDYVIRDLLPNTMYYIRVIAVTVLGEGPAAYTLASTKATNTDETSNTPATGLIIPLNLVVRAVGMNWARVGWELPELPVKPTNQHFLLFQIKYHSISQSESAPFAPSVGPTKLVNVSVPWTNQLTGQSKQFKATLHGLVPATQYEFGVSLLRPSCVDLGVTLSRPGPTKQGTDLCWSMVQGFETVGQGPSDAPRNVQVHFPPGNSSTVRFTWQPPAQPNGLITSYAIYWSMDRMRPLTDWSEHICPFEAGNDMTARSIRCDLPARLQPAQNYFARMVARNQHGASPFGSVLVFRTPDAHGRGGGRIQLSRVYHDARDIHEQLDRIHLEADHHTNGTVSRAGKADATEDQLRWIIVGSVLGGAIVCVAVAMVIVGRRCCQRRQTSGFSPKWLSSKNPYIAAYSQPHPSNHPSISPYSHSSHISASKAAHIHVADACLGSCSLSGSGAGIGSGCGAVPSVGPRLGMADASGDSGIQYDLATGPRPCACHTWSTTHPNHSGRPLGDSGRCACQTMSTECSVPVTWMPNNGGCWEDRQSTPGASEHDAGGSSAGGSRVLENGLTRELHSSGFRPHHVIETHTAAAREMTLSFLAADPSNNACVPSGMYLSDKSHPSIHPYHHQHQSPLHQPSCPRSASQATRYRGERSPEIRATAGRHPEMAHGITYCVDEDALTASPASSSAGHGSAGLRQLASSGNFNGKVHQSSTTAYLPVVRMEPKSPRRLHMGPTVHLERKSSHANEVNPSNSSSPTHTTKIGMSYALDRVPTPESVPKSGSTYGCWENRAELKVVPGEPISLLTPNLMKRPAARLSPTGLAREYSAEELHQEMASLEGLMKDLNQITSTEFEC